MISNTSPQREEYLKKKRKRRLIKYGLILFSIVLVVGFLSYISHRPKLRISKVELSGEILVTQKDIEKETLSYLKGSYVWLFPKNNIFLYPHKSLVEDLMDKFKRIDTIDVHLKNFNILAINITERKPVAIWCDTLPAQAGLPGEAVSNSTTRNISSGMRPSESDGSTEDTSPKCYFIDQNSTIFAKSPYFSGDAYFKYYGLISPDSPIGKEYIASTTQFAEISNFVAKVKNLSLKPQYLIAKSDGQFSLVIAGGGEIYFDIRQPLSLVASNLETLLRTPALSTSTTYNLPIKYIDLRYGDKLFYKLK